VAKRRAKFSFSFVCAIVIVIVITIFRLVSVVRAALILFCMEIFSLPQPHPEVVGVYVINCGPDTLRARRSFAVATRCGEFGFQKDGTVLYKANQLGR